MLHAFHMILSHCPSAIRYAPGVFRRVILYCNLFPGLLTCSPGNTMLECRQTHF
jgi:hypothetical protein